MEASNYKQPLTKLLLLIKTCCTPVRLINSRQSDRRSPIMCKSQPGDCIAEPKEIKKTGPGRPSASRARRRRRRKGRLSLCRVYGLVLAPPLIAVIRQLREKSRTYPKNQIITPQKRRRRRRTPFHPKKAVRNV